MSLHNQLDIERALGERIADLEQKLTDLRTAIPKIERLEELAVWFGSHQDLPDLIQTIESFPTLLAAERRKAFLEAAKLMCAFCQLGKLASEKENGVYWHLGEYTYACEATPIHRKLAEEVER